ncbi:hypothetical protein SAMD00019534_050930 [Acytostelium subglobosum LB1]|uniref:hypothetical protein n=1 Tax=Acytostelium subglobosum LB1 TaxID=1410327 RepID=UPI000644D33A|nr:hypothetical protein SAMD00019534_050930 [Acytostelium subglobosum LB1]GAM21918.1 hypothetical protein SAMD00019534_050930 [Acytostelium subglobosum LB1]|eukprot:XP_012755018.1 hypothetical protein SAMD00019534_050930 [Acytostelium subglobosum LB1]
MEVGKAPMPPPKILPRTDSSRSCKPLPRINVQTPPAKSPATIASANITPPPSIQSISNQPQPQQHQPQQPQIQQQHQQQQDNNNPIQRSTSGGGAGDDSTSDLSSNHDSSFDVYNDVDDDVSNSQQPSMTTEEELDRAKQSLQQAKSTIASLIEQISDYQTMVEEEKEREKEQFLLHIEEMAEELDALKKEKNSMAQSNVKNLETLMHEMDLIEETNTNLRESLEAETQKYAGALETIDQLKDELAKRKSQPSNSGNSKSACQLLSQMTLELVVHDGVVSKVKLMNAQPNDPSYSGASNNYIQPSIVELEDERTELLKKLLSEKENHGKTLTSLREEKLRAESNKSSADELVKKVKELIKLHSNTLKDLEEERHVSQQRADQITELRLHISRQTTAPRLQRTHSNFTTLKRTSTQSLSPLLNNKDGGDSPKHNIELLPLSPLTPSASSSSPSAAANLIHAKHLGHLNPPPSPDGADKIGPGQSSSPSVPMLKSLKQSPPTTPTYAGAEDDSLFDAKSESRLLKRSAASLDLNASTRRMAKVASILGSNENMVTWLSIDPAPAPIQCMAEVGKHVWVGCSDGSIRVIDRETQNTVVTRQAHNPHGIYTLVVVGKTVWSSSRDSKIKVWSIKSGKLLKELEGHSSHVTSLLLVGQNMWSISADMAIRVWSTTSFRCIKKIETKSYLVSMAKFGNQIWIGTESTILRWDATTYEPIDNLVGHKKMVHCMIPVDNNVWSCSSDNLIIVWDPHTGKLVRRLTDHKSRVFYLLRVNNHVWSCAWDRTIKIHSVETHALIKEIEPVHRDAISCMALVSRAGILTPQIWSGSWDHTIIIWKSSDPVVAPPSIVVNHEASLSASGTSSLSQGMSRKNTTSKLETKAKRGSVRLSLFFGSRSDQLISSASSPNLFHETKPGGTPITDVAPPMPQAQSQQTLHLGGQLTTQPSYLQLQQQHHQQQQQQLQQQQQQQQQVVSPRSVGGGGLLSPRSQSSVSLLNGLSPSAYNASSLLMAATSPPRRTSSSIDFDSIGSSGSMSSMSSINLTGTPHNNQQTIVHDLVKIHHNSVTCSICQLKIQSTLMKKQVFHCKNCLSNYHIDCVDRAMSSPCPASCATKSTALSTISEK